MSNLEDIVGRGRDADTAANFGTCGSALLVVDVATGCVAAKNDAAERLLPDCHMGASFVLWVSMGEAEMVVFLERAEAGGYLNLHDHQAPTAAENCICTAAP